MTRHDPPPEDAKGHGFNDAFRRFAHRSSIAVGSKWAFVVAILVIVVWGVTGPIFGFSDTWQLIINTGTTIVTFLMVFLIQNTQNRDAMAIHLKLDELIRGVKGARTRLVNLEDFSDEELAKLHEQFETLRREGRHVGRRAARAHEAASDARDRAADADERATRADQTARAAAEKAESAERAADRPGKNSVG